MIDRIKRTIKTFEEMDLQTLKAYKFILLFLIVGDMIGVWWYLGWKTLAAGILIVSLIFFALIIILESRKQSDQDVKEYFKEEKPKKSKKQSSKDSEDNSLSFGIEGLPDSEEYNKRLDKAFGVGF